MYLRTYLLSPPFVRSVMNDSSQEEVSIRDVRILPNLNASYLPVMPDGSVLLVDNVWCVTDFVVMHFVYLNHVTLFLPFTSVLLPFLSCCFCNTSFLFCLYEHRSCCFLPLSTAISQVRSAWGLSAGWTAWPAAFPTCSVLWRSMTSCSSFTSTTSLKMTPMRFGSFGFLFHTWCYGWLHDVCF